MKCFVLISQKFTANYVTDYPDFHLPFLELFGKVSFCYGAAKQILGTSFCEKSLRANFSGFMENVWLKHEFSMFKLPKKEFFENSKGLRKFWGLAS